MDQMVVVRTEPLIHQCLYSIHCENLHYAERDIARHPENKDGEYGGHIHREGTAKNKAANSHRETNVPVDLRQQSDPSRKCRPEVSIVVLSR
jgi:hypothetical protein